MVCSVSTIPSRLTDPYFTNTLIQIKNQTYPLDAIYLSIPYYSTRFKQSYPSIPEEITQICTVVELEQDYGPICKLIGALYQETDPDTIIITIDDDVRYPLNFVEELIKRHQDYPNSAIGFSGLCWGKFPFYNAENILNKNKSIPDDHLVDSLCGIGGVLYQRQFFPSVEKLYSEILQYVLSDEDIFCHDDLMISAYLNYHQIERRLFHPPFKYGTKVLKDGLSSDFFFRLKYIRALFKLSNRGFIKSQISINPLKTKSAPFVIPAILIFLILIIVFIILFSVKVKRSNKKYLN